MRKHGAKIQLIFEISKFCARIFCVFRFFVVSLHPKNQTTMEEIKKQLREIANTPARNLSKEQREFIRQTAVSLEMELPQKTSCNSCWLDLAVACYSKMTVGEKATFEQVGDKRRFILKPNVDVYFGSIRVNAATLTDELAESILARGFERKFFLKCE